MGSSIGRVACAALLVAGSAVGATLALTEVQPRDHGLAPQGDRAATRTFLDSYGNLPLVFEPNVGQAGSGVEFISRGRGYVLLLRPAEALLALPGSERASSPEGAETGGLTLGMRLVGADPATEAQGASELPGTVNYLIGDDPERWQTGIPTFSEVVYRDAYSGIDLRFHGSRQRLEYDFVVDPGADVGDIRLAFTGVGPPAIDGRGDLVLRTPGGAVRWRKPQIYQVIDGTRRPVRGGFVLLRGDRVGFRVGRYDHDVALIIDPLLAYSTFLGGAGTEDGIGIAVDASGSAYVTGSTMSANFRTAAPLQGALLGTEDGYIAKLDPSGGALVYSTYFGGSGADRGRDIAVDAAGNAYVAGATASADLPIVNPVQSVLGGGEDAFVLKLDPTGSTIVYSTYLGGRSQDGKPNIALDAAGRAHVVGYTFSKNFPLVGARQTRLGGGADAFVAKLDVGGNALLFSTYLGGNKSDTARGVAVDAAGNVFVTGFAYSTNFPTANPIQATSGGDRDAFITALNPTGTTLIYSTYLGGSLMDSSYRGNSIAVDPDGTAYVTGFTASTNFPTASPFQASSGGSRDAYAAKISPTGQLIFSTYLGGAGAEEGNSIAVDGSGRPVVVGHTASDNFPVVSPIQDHRIGSQDVFVTQLAADGGALVYSTYLGGGGIDIAQGVALDGSGAAYVTGQTSSSNFPTANPVQASNAGGLETFVFKITP
ncbi:MAG: DUF7948 domain-containing protein [Actinomycetota bacterium]